MVIPASWLPRLPLVTSTYEISQPSAARRAIVPPQINSASSGWAIITNIRCPPGGSKTVDVVVMIVAFLPSDQIGRRGEPLLATLLSELTTQACCKERANITGDVGCGAAMHASSPTPASD